MIASRFISTVGREIFEVSFLCFAEFVTAEDPLRTADLAAVDGSQDECPPVPCAAQVSSTDFAHLTMAESLCQCHFSIGRRRASFVRSSRGSGSFSRAILLSSTASFRMFGERQQF
jgi:hypothetical protein